ncbi:MAG: DNA mismatch repair endonuclease MutL [Bacteriovoracaceae bacterium]
MDYQEKNSKIKLLPEHIIDQIKAGEVIERPASLVKELLENALDARASKLSLHLVNNGLELLELVDNGEGMSYDELPFAFCRHATSKLSRFEDLYSLNSYGFRGEALASLASVARVRCTSLQKNHKGGKLIINGGVVESLVHHQGHNAGTSFYIKDLFYNTPARLKFIKSKTSEKNALLKIIHGFLLSYPEIDFELKWDDKDKEIYQGFEKGNDGLKKRLKDLYFKKNLLPAIQEKSLLHFEQCYDKSTLSLTLLSNEAMVSGAKCQYILVNGRQIQDKQIHSILSHFENLLGDSTYSHYFLSLTLAPEDLDVNVHPNKLFVKFHNAGEIMGLVSATLKAHEQKRSASVENKTYKHTIENHFQFEENFSLKDLKDNKQTHRATTLEEEMALATIQNKSHPLFLQTNFCLKEGFEGYYLIKISSLLKHHLMQSLSEEESIPLMISEPILCSIDDPKIKELKSLGFEIDRLNPETMALRAMPKNFEKVNTRIWFRDFLLFFLKEKKVAHDCLKNFLEKQSPDLRYERDYVNEVIGEYELPALQALGCAQLLDTEHLQKILR